MRSAQHMRPREIAAARDGSGVAFVPVSPQFEWHSYHLPLGTDAVIAETLSRLVAERVGGIYFPVLSFGMDAIRNEKECAAWGLNVEDQVYGMRHPGLPVMSEYATKDEMLKTLANRIEAIRLTGFRHAFIVNNHGGKGQREELARFAEDATTDACAVHYVSTYKFRTLDAGDLVRVGGHAGLSETMLVLAFRPDLVDLTQIPDGELSVAEMGILHNKPTIEAKYNPRNAMIAVANDVRENMVSNFTELVRETIGEAS